MEDPPTAHGAPPGRPAPGAGPAALRHRLDALHDALAEETRRRERARAGWGEEVRRHQETRAELVTAKTARREAEAALAVERARGAAIAAAAADVARVARGVLAPSEAPAPAKPARREPVTARLAAVLQVVAAPGAEPPDAPELARRFERVRAELTAAR